MNANNMELAKDLVLAGVSLAIYDDRLIESNDLRTNLFITNEDVG